MKVSRKARSFWSVLVGGMMLTAGLLIGCQSVEEEVASAPVETTDSVVVTPKFWAWMHGLKEPLDSSAHAMLSRLDSAGISAVLTGGDADYLNRFIPIAQEYGIEVHAWTWIVNQPGNQECQSHPEWYAVSREGKSSLEERPYVDYYQWLCPSKHEVRQYLKAKVADKAQVPGLAAVHFDYIRWPDVILPSGLWEKYDLVMDKEYPPYDFCYCGTCHAAYAAETGNTIDTNWAATEDTAWRAYRYQVITNLVAELSDTVRSHGVQTNAAVFPYPDLARKLVRQSWDDWDLDAILPMIYHNFYEEDIAWVGMATEAGVTDLNGKFPLHTGLYLPSLTPEEMKEAIDQAMANGAEGVAFFEANGLTAEHLAVLKSYQAKD